MLAHRGMWQENGSTTLGLMPAPSHVAKPPAFVAVDSKVVVELAGDIIEAKVLSLADGWDELGGTDGY
jgi:hypothetical protein